MSSTDQEEAKMFEIGKFYKIPVMCGFSSKPVVSRCVRILKYSIEFEHFCINYDNVLSLSKRKYKKYGVSRGFGSDRSAFEMCGSGEQWSTLGFGRASDEVPKPDWWEERLSHVGEKVERKEKTNGTGK